MASAALPLSGAQQETGKPGMKPVANVEQLMKLVTIPASDVVFNIAADGPKKDSEWLDVQNNALLVAESANLLMMPGRARDNQAWMKEAQAMLDTAMLAFNAAAAKNADQLADASDKIYSTCESCHETYMAK
jgi:hypothetical protein